MFRCRLRGVGNPVLRPLRRVNVETLPQFLACTFGNLIRPFGAVSDGIGIFLTIPAQAPSANSFMPSSVRGKLPELPEGLPIPLQRARGETNQSNP
jgi:hypothetical protein